MSRPRRPPSLVVVAGEPSGDVLGASVVREIRSRRPDLEVFGLGGDELACAGAELLCHVRELSVTGFFGVFLQVPRHNTIRRRLVEEVESRRPDAALFVDYPGFNIRVSADLHALGVPVAYFVAPKVWVWKRDDRPSFLSSHVDRMLVLFRFEEAIWRAAGVPVTFVGHPARDLVRPAPDRASFLSGIGLDPARPVLALLPGSRRSEVGRILPAILSAAEELVRREPSLQPLVALSESLDPALLPRALCGAPLRFAVGRTHEVLGAARLGLVACGTAALEAALLGTPCVIVYRVDPLTYRYGLARVKITRYALPNILAGRDVMPELIQGDMTPARIVEAALPLLAEGEARRRMLEGYGELLGEIGPPGAAARAADEVLELMDAGQARRAGR